MAITAEPQAILERASRYPRLRYMGNKHRLLPWLHEAFARLEGETALDAFSGSGCVAYLLKAMGRAVTTNDALLFPRHLAAAAVENASVRLGPLAGDLGAERAGSGYGFIRETFAGVFFDEDDLRFLDAVWSNLDALPTDAHRALAHAALARACLKRQPRGVFTVGGAARYDDGRRDLRLSLREHFAESVALWDDLVFEAAPCFARQGDALQVEGEFDLVYLDPPYVPRADDNCYVKRYHFLEGLACYWRGDACRIQPGSKVKKIEKRRTPFGSRRTALGAFEALFARFARGALVLSYSSNGWPDLDVLRRLLRRHRRRVRVLERDHRYHFGTHGAVARERAQVREYLLVGT